MSGLTLQQYRSSGRNDTILQFLDNNVIYTTYFLSRRNHIGLYTICNAPAK